MGLYVARYPHTEAYVVDHAEAMQLRRDHGVRIHALGPDVTDEIDDAIAEDRRLDAMFGDRLPRFAAE